MWVQTLKKTGRKLSFALGNTLVRSYFSSF